MPLGPGPRPCVSCHEPTRNICIEVPLCPACQLLQGEPEAEAGPGDADEWEHVSTSAGSTPEAPPSEPIAEAPSGDADHHVPAEAPSDDAGHHVPAFPPEPSTRGLRYYVFESRHDCGPVIAAGWRVALRLLGGTWFSKGPSPKGYSTLDDAAAASCRAFPQADLSVVRH